MQILNFINANPQSRSGKSIEREILNEAEFNANVFEGWKPDKKMRFIPYNCHQLMKEPTSYIGDWDNHTNLWRFRQSIYINKIK